jgi:hypothetical protein
MGLFTTFHLKSPFKAQLPDGAQTLNAECQTYFSQVLAHYQLLPPTAAPKAEEIELRKFADIIVARKPEDRTRADLFALEICVVKLLPELDLRRGAWAIRCKYKDLAGPKEFDAYQASNPPDPTTDTGARRRNARPNRELPTTKILAAHIAFTPHGKGGVSAFVQFFLSYGGTARYLRINSSAAK